MTKKLSFLLICIFVISLTGCGFNSDLTSQKPSSEPSDNKAYIKIELASNSRTALPLLSKEDFDSFTLRGVLKDQNQNDDTLVNFGTWSSYSELNNLKIEVATGEWSFILTAAKGTNIYADFIETEISENENLLSFVLRLCSLNPTSLSYIPTSDFQIEEGKGNAELTFSYSNTTEIKSATASLYTLNNEPVDSYKEISLSLSQNQDNSTALLSLQNIDSGVYIAKINFYYDESKQILAQKVIDYVYISKDLTSKDTIEIPHFYNLYTVTYETFDCDWNDDFVPQSYFTKYSTIQLPEKQNLNKDNITFEGWYFDNNFTTPASDMPKKNLTLYAKLKKTYSVNVYKQNEQNNEYDFFKTVNATSTLGRKCLYEDFIISDFEGYTPGRIESDIITANDSSVNVFIDLDFKEVSIIVTYLEKYHLDPYETVTLKISADKDLTSEDLENMYKDYHLYLFETSPYDSSQHFAVFGNDDSIAFANYVKNYNDPEFVYTADGSLSYFQIDNILFNYNPLYTNFESIRLNLRKLSDIERIEEGEFMGRPQIKELELPDSVTFMYQNVFIGTNLETFTVSKNLTIIGPGALGPCKEVIFEDFENWHLASAGSYNKPSTKIEDIDPEILADPKKAAEYLKACNYNEWVYKGDEVPYLPY